MSDLDEKLKAMRYERQKVRLALDKQTLERRTPKSMQKYEKLLLLIFITVLSLPFTFGLFVCIAILM